MRNIKKNAANISSEEAALKAIEFVKNKDLIKKLEDDNKRNRKPIEAYLDATARPCEKGIFTEIPYSDKVVLIKKTLRVSRSLTDDFVEKLKSAGLEDCITYEPSIDENKLEAYYHRGKVSDELLDSLYNVKFSPVLTVQLNNRYEQE